MDRFARLFGPAFLLASTWPSSAGANASQSAALIPAEAKLPRAQLRTAVLEDHRIVIDSDGVSPETSKYEAQLEHMFGAIEHQPCRRLLLFVHGGLTTLQTANQLAEDVGDRIESSSPDTYPIFLDWDSGLLSSYNYHLAYERNGISYCWASDRIHLKAFGLEPHDCPAGYSSGPRKHGEFPEFEFWNPDFWQTTNPPKFYRHWH